MIIGRYKPVNNIQPAQNEVDNPLANLLCQYNSDSDTEDPKKEQVQKLDDKVNDFFKVSTQITKSVNRFFYSICYKFVFGSLAEI